VILTRALLENLFSSFLLPLPDELKTPRGPSPIPSYMLPPGVSKEEVADLGAFVLCAGIFIFSVDLAPAEFEYDGIAHSFHSYMPTTGESGNGWVSVETVLVRLSDLFVPNATFPVWGSAWGSTSRIGYDAVVCVEMCEPWIVQIYNSSLGIPTTMAIVSKSATTDFETDDGNRGPRLDSYTRVLNSTDKDFAYLVRYAGSFSFERY